MNHRIPHKGDRSLFFDPENLESVCKPCHDGPVQATEVRGFAAAVDAGGFPVDPLHPAARASRRAAAYAARPRGECLADRGGG